MSNSSSSATASASFSWLGLLGVIFVVFKLLPPVLGGYPNPVHDWSWWLVLLPFYGGLAIFLGFLLLAAFGVTVYTFLIEPVVQKRRAKKHREALAARGRRGR